MIPSLLAWLLIAAIVGLIANKIVDLHGDDPRFALAVAAGGAVLAGVLYVLLSPETARGWDRWGLLFATIGAASGAAIWHGVRSRYVSHAHQTSRRSY